MIEGLARGFFGEGFDGGGGSEDFVGFAEGVEEGGLDKFFGAGVSEK